MLPYAYEVTKYDPADRDGKGRYTGGQDRVSDHGPLEAAYLRVVADFAAEPTGFATMIGDNLAVPFETTVLGVTVTVREIGYTGSGIIAICARVSTGRPSPSSTCPCRTRLRRVPSGSPPTAAGQDKRGPPAPASRKQHRDIGRVSALPARAPPGMEAAWQEGAALARPGRGLTGQAADDKQNQ